MNLRKILAYVLIFMVLESLAVVYSVWPAIFVHTPYIGPEIRIGVILPNNIDRQQYISIWSAFAKDFGSQFSCTLSPYFAGNFEEAEAGLVNGSLDLIYSDALTYIGMNRKVNLEPWFYHKISRREKELKRTVIVTEKDVLSVNDTAGMRMIFADREAESNFNVAVSSLSGKISSDYRKWFSSVSVADDRADAFKALFAGKTDVIICNRSTLDQVEKNFPEDFRKLRIIWMSKAFPENLIYSMDYLSPEIAQILRNAMKELENRTVTEDLLSEKFLMFVPVTFSYKDEMKSLANELSPNKNGRKSQKNPYKPEKP